MIILAPSSGSQKSSYWIPSDSHPSSSH